jgi:UDP-3-O-[3-hydroxymyristoyl] glucosamine N-acyltransferase
VAKSYRLKDLVEKFDLQLHGDPETVITGVGSIKNAAPGEISFLTDHRLKHELNNTAASAVILNEKALTDCPVNALISGNVYVDYARVASLFNNAPVPVAGIHARASVSSSAHVPASASVAANAVIEDGVKLGEGTTIGAGSVIGVNARVGDQCHIAANVTICHAVVLGNRVIVHPGAVIGADGYGLAFDEGCWVKIPQLGSVEIGDDCEIGANTTIDRGTIGNTILEEDVRLDNQIQIAHNVFIGAHTAMAGCTAIAGSAKIGRNCRFGGNAGVTGHIEIADNVTLLARCLATRSISEAGVYGGIEAQPNTTWRRNLARLRQLDSLVRRWKKLEKDFEVNNKS